MASVILLGTAAAMGGMSFLQAKRRNEAIEESQQAQVQAGREQQRQLSQQDAEQRRDRISQARRLSGVIRLAGAERGTGNAGASLRQADLDAAIDLERLQRNLDLRQQLASSQVNAANIRLNAQRQSTTAAGITGGLQGAQAGLSIATGAKNAELM